MRKLRGHPQVIANRVNVRGGRQSEAPLLKNIVPAEDTGHLVSGRVP